LTYVSDQLTHVVGIDYTVKRIPKFFQYLIIVWTVVCLSGLGIFLFELYGPQLTPQTAYQGTGVLTTLGFFLFLWGVPVGTLATIGRRQKEQP